MVKMYRGVFDIHRCEINLVDLGADGLIELHSAIYIYAFRNTYIYKVVCNFCNFAGKPITAHTYLLVGKVIITEFTFMMGFIEGVQIE